MRHKHITPIYSLSKTTHESYEQDCQNHPPDPELHHRRHPRRSRRSNADVKPLRPHRLLQVAQTENNPVSDARYGIFYGFCIHNNRKCSIFAAQYSRHEESIQIALADGQVPQSEAREGDEGGGRRLLAGQGLCGADVLRIYRGGDEEGGRAAERHDIGEGQPETPRDDPPEAGTVAAQLVVSVLRAIYMVLRARDTSEQIPTRCSLLPQPFRDGGIRTHVREGLFREVQGRCQRLACLCQNEAIGTQTTNKKLTKINKI